ncbi:MAG: glycosyltransferase [Solirubrobacteraceae bacterium]
MPRAGPGDPLPEISVIVRARDEAPSIGRCLELLAGQRTEGRSVEVIVVDSGSRDRTVQIARSHGARTIAIPPREFTFGRALNLGAAGARGELLVALSAHAFAVEESWLSRLAERLSDPGVACACGERYGPDDLPLTAAVEQDLALARRRPMWGYSNGAGAFPAALWRRRPFREDLPGCEDKEWALHWLAHGYRCVVDPALSVEHDHTRDSLLSLYRRARREAAGYASFLDLPPYGPSALAREWWCQRGWHSSALRARASPRRAARLVGTYAGRARVAGGARAPVLEQDPVPEQAPVPADAPMPEDAQPCSGPRDD